MILSSAWVGETVRGINKRGHAIPLAQLAEYVEGIDTSDLTMLGWLDNDIDVTLYDDDGYTTYIDLAKGLRTLHAKA